MRKFGHAAEGNGGIFGDECLDGSGGEGEDKKEKIRRRR